MRCSWSMQDMGDWVQLGGGKGLEAWHEEVDNVGKGEHEQVVFLRP